MKTRRPRLRRWIRGVLLGAFVLLLVGLVIKDWAARKVAEAVASSITGGPVSIGDMRLSLGHVVVEGIDVREPSDVDEPQVTVDRVQIDLTLWRGIREGVWVENVLIERPTLHLRFDRDGQLISRFPGSEPSESEPSSGPLPLEALAVNDACVVVHQDGRKDFSLEGMKLRVLTGEQVEVRGVVPELFGGSCNLQSRFDVATLEGRTRLAVTQLSLDTEKLKELAMIGPLIEVMEPTTGSVALDFDLVHPANCTDPRELTAEGRIAIGPVGMKRCGTIVESIETTVRAKEGRLSAQVLGSAVKGSFGVWAECDANASPLAGTIKVQARNIQPAELATKFGLPDDVAASVAVDSTTQVVWDQGKLKLDGNLGVAVSEINLQGIAVEPVLLWSEVQATADAQQNLAESLAGQLDVSVTSDGVSLDQFREMLPQHTLQGRVDAGARLHVPLATVADLRSYKAKAYVRARDVAANQIVVAPSQLTLELTDGKATCRLDGATLTNPKTRETTVLGLGATAQLVPAGDIAANTSVDSLTLATIGQLLGVPMKDCGGSLSAQASAKAPLSQAADLGSWLVTGRLNGDQLVIAGEAIHECHGDLRIENKEISAANLRVGWRDNKLLANATGHLIEPTRIAGKLRVGPVNLSDVSQVLSRYSSSPLPLTGAASLDGNFSADLARQVWQATGRLDADHLRFAHTKIGSSQLEWSADPSGAKLRAASDRCLGGSFEVTATMNQLDWTNAVIAGKCEGVQVPRLVSLAGSPVASTGSLSGQFQLTSLASPSTLKGRAQIQTHGVSVQQVPVESFQGLVQLAQGTATLVGKGNIGGGELDAKAKANLESLIEFGKQSPQKLSQLPVEGSIRLAKLPIKRCVQFVKQERQLRPLTGFINAEVSRKSSDAEKGIVASGSASLKSVRWGPAVMSEQLTAEFVVDGVALDVRQINGKLAGGRVLGRAKVAIDQPSKGTFQVALNRADLRRLTRPLGKATPTIGGTADVSLEGRLGQQITGRAMLAMDRVTVDSLAVKRVRVPVTWSVNPHALSARWNTRDARIEIGGGSIRTKAEGRWSNGLDLTLTSQMRRIDTGKLTRVNSSSAGIIDGTVRLRARRADSPNDFVGNFDIKLSQVKAFEMPVLSDMTRLISIGPSASDGDGTIRGRIGGGIVRLDHMQLAAANARVLINGTATFAGRLNMDVTATTGQEGPADALLELADSPLMLAAPAPVALIAKANKALKNRVVHVQISGSATNPMLRLNPGKQLGQQAIQFFLTPNYLPTFEKEKEL